MTAFYKNYVSLCARNGVSLSAAAEAVGLSRTAPNGWKKGKEPSDTSLHKIADYFGVTVEYLISEQKEKPTAGNGDELDETTRRLLDLFKNADEQKRQEMLNYAEYLLSKRDKSE